MSTVEEEVEGIVALEGQALKEKITALVQENRDLKQKIASLEEEEECLFEIDTDPVEDENENKDKDSSESILYNSVSGNALKEGDQDSSKSPSPTGPKSTCFNCCGDHMIADCPKPRDPQAIARNRREFQKKQGVSSQRYHVDEDQRFNHLRPGIPSAKLSKALGLRDDQLPSYIYRMRQLGYPPGWLKEAEIHRSGVSLYLAESQTLGDLGDEDGEVTEDADKVQYDVDKLMEWPGFNAEIPSEYRDEARHYGCPPMQEDQKKAHMLAEFEKKGQKGYVKGTMQDTSTKKDKVAAKRTAQDDTEGEPSAKKTKVEAVPALKSKEAKSVADGTPIVSLYSPYEGLPSQDKWATGTTDHILFENLPDSTGKWDQMLEVIKKGRKVREGLAKADAAE